ncbi:uncharacterized protein [Watersipora subatra]|uniref:uncharacterized protein n=1 Tax=Watersipora subatra TaxID=2589382 RepID=UPI00355B6367
MTNEKLFMQTGSGPLSSRLKFIRLRWAGHVNRMPSMKIPHMIIHGVLENGTHQTGRPRLRFKDVLKRDLKDFSMQPETWTSASRDRPNWRSSLHDGCKADAQKTLEKLRLQRLSKSQR